MHCVNVWADSSLACYNVFWHVAVVTSSFSSLPSGGKNQLIFFLFFFHFQCFNFFDEKDSNCVQTIDFISFYCFNLN